MKNAICIAFSLLLPVLAFGGKKVDKSVEFIDGGYVDIANVNGQIRVTPWESKSVKVAGELGDNTKRFTFERNGNRISIKVEVNNGHSSSRVFDNLVINVPHKSNVSYAGVNASFTGGELIGEQTLSAVNGTLAIDNNQGQVKATTVNGKIDASRVTGNMEVQTVNGTVTVTNSTVSNGSFSTTSGELNIKCDCESVAINTVSGDVDIEPGRTKQLSFSGVSGDAKIRLGLKQGGTVNATSVSGDVTLSFIDDPSAYFDITTPAGGSITNRLTDDQVVKEKYGPGRHLQFTHLTGEGKVTVTTVSGGITLEKP